MSRDTYLVAGCAAAGAAFLAAGVLAADVAHAMADPRIAVRGVREVPSPPRGGSGGAGSALALALLAALVAGRAVARALRSRAPVLRLSVRAADAAAPGRRPRARGTRRSPIRCT